MSEQIYFIELVQSLQLLAADYHVQNEVFPAYAHAPDEIALIYNSSAELSEQVLNAGLIRQIEHEKVVEIDNFFEQKSCEGHDEFWTTHALRESDEWETIRLKAATLLALLGQPQEHPRLRGLNFIPGKDPRFGERSH